MKATMAFKQFLTNHQQVIKKQEAKKEKLVGKGIKGRSGFQGPSKMKILPHHYHQEDRYSTAGTSSYDSENSTMLQMQEDNQI